jgi:hypothetical protein
MNEHNILKEWGSNDDLPQGFTEWLNDVVRECRVTDNLEFRQIGAQLGVNPSFLSRWLGGMGPLTQTDINLLASNLSPVVYTFLGLPRPQFED